MWDNSMQPPSVDNLLAEFQTFLVDKKLKADLKLANNAMQNCCYQSNCKTSD
jgi:hypothetical protein